jgi:hypothetical protein
MADLFQGPANLTFFGLDFFAAFMMELTAFAGAVILLLGTFVHSIIASTPAKPTAVSSLVNLYAFSFQQKQ